MKSGAFHDTTTWPLPGLVVTEVGAVGRVSGVVSEVDGEAGPRPFALVANTENV